MHNPYADVIAKAASAVSRMPRLADEPRRDPVTAPSPAERRARDARLAASLVATIAFRSTINRRGDYAAFTAGCPSPFHTKR